MKKFATALSALALGTVAASAADLPARIYTKAPPPPVVAVYDWSGFYLGVNGGGGGGQKCWNFVSAGVDAGCHNVSGGLAGGQIGYNWQSSNFVFGVELSGDWANLTGSNVPVLLSSGTDHSHVSGIFMATARAGYAWDRALLYIRGGAAWVRQDYFRSCNGVTATGFCTPVGFIPFTGSETRVGGVVGAGFEYAVTNNVILGIEGDYFPLGTRDNTFKAVSPYSCGEGPGQPCTIAVKENLWTVTGRLSWKFGGPVVARY